MDSLKKRNWSATRQLAMIVICQVLLFLFSSCALAQMKVTANPGSVSDPAKPGQVVLHVTKSDDSIDPTLNDQLGTVKVGGGAVDFKLDTPSGNVTITPPANLAGPQTVQLFDKGGKPLAETELRYPSSSSPSPTPSPSATASPCQSPTCDPIEARKEKLINSNWYYFIVTVMFLGLLFPFGITIARSIRFSRSTYNSPLGLPVGSFRAILAYTLVAFLGFYILTSVLSVSQFAPPDFLLGIVATVVGFYFGSRTGEEAGMDSRAGTVRGIVHVGTNPARGALVKFKRDDGTEPFSRITDVDGRFELRGAKPGKYKVSAALTGSPPSETVDITVAEGSDHEIKIVIKEGGQAPPSTTGTVEGIVTKADKTLAEGANVVLSQGSIQKPTTTDAKGKYKFENVPFGEYNIVASLGGMSSETKKVTVAAGPLQPVDLQLKIESIKDGT